MIIIIYHELCKNISEKEKDKSLNNTEKKIDYKSLNILEYHHGGKYLDTLYNNIIKTKEEDFFWDIEKYLHVHFKELLELIIKKKIKDVTQKPKTRKQLCVIYKFLIANYWNRNISNKFLKEKYEIEHIFPFSSNWKEGIEIDIDRLGNIFPTISEINKKRGIKHINIYEDYSDFYSSIKKLLKIDCYDNIIKYKKEIKKNIIFSSDEYNKFCKINEELYIDELIKELF